MTISFNFIIKTTVGMMLCIALHSDLHAAKQKKLEGSWKRVYLATYPRSGNHWARELVEEASRIATGSVYHDNEPPHMRTYFPWKGYAASGGCIGKCREANKNDIVLIKTHFPALLPMDGDQSSAIATIRIVRHPVDSIYSSYKFDARGREQPDRIPREKLIQYIDAWKKFQVYWNSQPNVITFRYEDMYNDPLHYLSIMLNTLQYKVSEKDMQRAVEEYPSVGGFLKYLNCYTQKDLSLIQKKLKPFLNQFHYEIDQIKNLDK